MFVKTFPVVQQWGYGVTVTLTPTRFAGFPVLTQELLVEPTLSKSFNTPTIAIVNKCQNLSCQSIHRWFLGSTVYIGHLYSLEDKNYIHEIKVI